MFGIAESVVSLFIIVLVRGQLLEPHPLCLSATSEQSDRLNGTGLLRFTRIPGATIINCRFKLTLEENDNLVVNFEMEPLNKTENIFNSIGQCARFNGYNYCYNYISRVLVRTIRKKIEISFSYSSLDIAQPLDFDIRYTTGKY